MTDHPIDVGHRRQPFEQRVSCALDSVDIMRRVLALVMYSHAHELLPAEVVSWTFSKQEIDQAPVKSLLVRRHANGDVTVTLESES